MIVLSSLGLEAEVAENLSNCSIKILDQTQLPKKEVWLEIRTNQEMIEAIQSLRVRGAPLIGVAASLMIGKLACEKINSEELQIASQQLYEARPTAVNLMICVSRMQEMILATRSLNAEERCAKLLNLAIQIFNEDVELCQKMALNGAELIQDGDRILTHCNTGGLATAGVGTALGVIRKAHEQGKNIHVYIDETRPLLQGGRLTAWELKKLNIPCTLITDSMAAHLMSLKKITKAIVGSDRIATNGDFANKIGTYSVAVNCKFHNLPFYVAAPYTTVDRNCLEGSAIPIEQRNANEVKGYADFHWAPDNIQVYNPAFDVTPSALVAAWILDRGVYYKDDIKKGVLSLC